jgi:capsular exopolysaccharide synthesis family protein
LSDDRVRKSYIPSSGGPNLRAKDTGHYTSGESENHQKGGLDVTIGQYSELVRRWGWLIVLCALLGALAGFAVGWLMPPVYEAEVMLRVNPPAADTASTTALQVDTYAEILCTQTVLEEVIDHLGLNAAAEQLSEHVDASPIQDTQLILLTAQDMDPQRAIAIANEIAAVFIDTNTEESLQAELASLQETIYQTQASLDALGSPTTTTETAERDRLEALLNDYQSSYADLLISLEGVRRAETSAAGAVTIVEAAQEAHSVTSRLWMSLLLGTIPGGLLGAGLALLFEYNLGQTMATKSEVEALIDVPTLGVIAYIDGHDPLDALVTTVRPRSPIAEAYRVLRSNIGLVAGDPPPHTILVTSAERLEGKSTTAANLAIAAAQAGKRTILVDGNLRGPMLHRLFQQSNERGLSTAVMDENRNRASDYLVSTGLANLLLLPSGPPPSSPMLLLESVRLVQLFDDLKSQSDVVFIDSSALLPSHILDAALLASRCDATLLVVLATSTRTSQLIRARGRLTKAGARLLGVVLNGARPT